jgi:hypothetical protein
MEAVREAEKTSARLASGLNLAALAAVAAHQRGNRRRTFHPAPLIISPFLEQWDPDQFVRRYAGSVRTVGVMRSTQQPKKGDNWNWKVKHGWKLCKVMMN